MNPPTQNGSSVGNSPPDPGGRSRYLILCIAIACAVLVAVAVVLMLALREAQPPSVPKQQQQKSGAVSHKIANRRSC